MRSSDHVVHPVLREVHAVPGGAAQLVRPRHQLIATWLTMSSTNGPTESGVCPPSRAGSSIPKWDYRRRRRAYFFGTSVSLRANSSAKRSLHPYSSIGPIPHSQLRSLQSRIPTARSCPLRAGRRRPISRAHVLVRKPHTRRWQRLIWAVERRQDVQPPAILAQEVVATRTTTDGAVNARVGVRHRRDAEKPRGDHGGHRDEDRPHNRLTVVQADLPSEPRGRPESRLVGLTTC
jgi:hypothetical protein